MSNHRKRSKKKREPINFDEFKYEKPKEAEPLEEEEEEEKEQIDCCDRCLFSSLGFFLLYCGIFVIFFSERDHKYSQRDISYIKSNLQLLNISTMDTLLDNVIENKYPIHFIDKISNENEKNMIVMDDRTDLSYPGVALKINTEMYQWIETEETIRKEGTTQTESKYSYAKQWSNVFHDSSEFNLKDDYYNPQPTVSKLSTRNMWVDQIIIGHNQKYPLYLSKSLYRKLSKRNLWKNVTQTSAEYSEMEMWEMRDGYLFRAYDKAESYYAEPEKKEQTDAENEAETDTDDADEEQDEEGDNSDETENDDVLKAEDTSDHEERERVRLEKPRTMIGDIRMSVYSLDTRGEIISYLGGIKYVEDWNQYVLIPWKSPTNHKFAMLEYGEVSSEEAIQEFSTENVLKLWLTRLFTFIFIFVGLMMLQNVVQTTIKMLKISNGPFPFKTWSQTIIGAVILTIILWIVTILIAYVVGIIHLALTFVVLIVIGLFLNNKTVFVEDDTQELQTKHKKNK